MLLALRPLLAPVVEAVAQLEEHWVLVERLTVRVRPASLHPEICHAEDWMLYSFPRLEMLSFHV